MTIANKHRIDEQEYIQGELNSTIKHELIDGEVFAMVGASAVHNLISLNIAGALHQHLKGKPCRPYMNDMKVRITENFYYPDVLVDCSKLSPNMYFVETPILIVEVLSASTKSYDKTFKLQEYQRIPTLQEYLMVDQDREWVELRSRLDDWHPQYYEMGDELMLQSVGLKLAVADVYDGIDF